MGFNLGFKGLSKAYKIQCYTNNKTGQLLAIKHSFLSSQRVIITLKFMIPQIQINQRWSCRQQWYDTSTYSEGILGSLNSQ